MATPAPAASASAIDLCLARSVLYRTLTLGFARPSETSSTALSGADRATWEAAAGLVAASEARREGLRSALVALAEAATADGRELSHARLFGHAQGLVSPFETDWGNAPAAFRQPQDLADLAGYYLAFGLQPPRGADERVDHVACECEFMDFLARKEAYLRARAEGPEVLTTEEESTLAVVQEAGRRFLREHLGRFGRSFAGRLLREDAGGFYGALGSVLLAVLGAEGERLGVPLGPATLEVRPPAPDDAPMACGSSCGEAEGAEAPLIPLQVRRP
jgi:TorA maturation chaperone TorD